MRQSVSQSVIQPVSSIFSCDLKAILNKWVHDYIPPLPTRMTCMRQKEWCNTLWWKLRFWLALAVMVVGAICLFLFRLTSYVSYRRTTPQESSRNLTQVSPQSPNFKVDERVQDVWINFWFLSSPLFLSNIEILGRGEQGKNLGSVLDGD